MNTSELLQDCLNLQRSVDCLLLSSVSLSGEPLSSYAPYVEHEACFYIYVSELAEHTGNMLGSGKASAMFIESELSAKNLYIRKRAIIQASVKQVVEHSVLAQKVFNKMEVRHANTIALLRSLGDFKLLELTPKKGRYIVGFGKAYDWDVEAGTLTHISEKNIKRAR